MLVEHPNATCPACPGTLLYRFSATVSGWRVVFLCARCGLTKAAGTIDRANINHREELHARAVVMGEKFA